MIEIIKSTFRLLTFRITREEMLDFGYKHFAFGLLCTWLVGVGRYWDNPRVGLIQHLGFGSVVYIFALALLLWLVLLPLHPKGWSYFRVVTFISLVSPPAILYAIPVEKFTSLETSNTINAIFLFIVATWRVALLLFYLRRAAALDWLSVIGAPLLPLALIVVTLSILNLEKVVFDFMGGRQNVSPNDSAYKFLFGVSILSFFISPVLLTLYIIAIIVRVRNKPKEKTHTNLE